MSSKRKCRDDGFRWEREFFHGCKFVTKGRDAQPTFYPPHAALIRAVDARNTYKWNNREPRGCYAPMLFNRVKALLPKNLGEQLELCCSIGDNSFDFHYGVDGFFLLASIPYESVVTFNLKLNELTSLSAKADVILERMHFSRSCDRHAQVIANKLKALYELWSQRQLSCDKRRLA